ncbi:NAD(P)-binding protein [Basidiobolus meristosporus CBS 931.73]|uniref:NAD(P)-binding protein n=1 Tax=Basidiobolus meristosporus CBS 931.73 TaxID=1314790 RepID=A0A1Y1Y1Y1_9FUNG|nr:NAD(P)-binding protein [Basidiobolus meristosporus CBS 931.73]|eukprot:ORX92017.1 NAD(P)-binding protein [Basidiobolus meristosporus CBS 931.73]
MRYINEDQVLEATKNEWSNIINDLERSFVAKTITPERTSIQVPNAGASLFMPCWIEDANVGIKLVSVRPENAKKGLSTVPATIILLDAETGATEALLQATTITLIRTAGLSAIATRHLANPKSSTLVIFGAGNQARYHVQAMLAVLPSIKRVTICNRSRQNADKLASTLRVEHPELEFSALATSEDPEATQAAVSEADVICTTTNSNQPLFPGSWLKEGAHLNCIGSYTPQMHEFDAEAITRSRITVDTYEGCLEESGELIQALDQGIIRKSDLLADLHEICQYSKSNALDKIRRHEQDITLFKCVGTAIADVSLASFVLKKCEQLGLGMTI